MTLPKQVKLVEVGPRDGLQAEAHLLPLETRVEFINLLTNSGLQAIEVGSFVSPKWVPQMKDSGQLYDLIEKKNDVDYSLLVPNEKGFEDALTHHVTSIAIFTAASQKFCHKNMNMSIEESLDQFHRFVPKAKKKGLRVRGYLSCVLGCPYEGKVPKEKVHKIVQKLLSLGCDEISLGDTIGVGTPQKVQTLLKDIPAPQESLAVHFHDTYGQGLVNVYAALEKGIHNIDSAVSGLGGCPYAPGAAGNVATEDVLFLLNGLGIETQVKMENLLQAAHFIDDALARKTSSKASLALRQKS